MRPYAARRASLALAGVELDEKLVEANQAGHLLSSARRQVRVGKLSADLALSDSTLELDRLYVSLFGGDITAALAAQLVSLKPLDARVNLRTQLTGVNLRELDPEGLRQGKRAELSALAEVKYALRAQELEARVEIPRLSLDMLDAFLAYLDPSGLNESVQKNRKLLAAWYIKVAKPQVRLVSVWINHGNLNMDIEMDAREPIGAYLRSQLRRNRIRRLNILPLLPKLPAEK